MSVIASPEFLLSIDPYALGYTTQMYIVEKPDSIEESNKLISSIAKPQIRFHYLNGDDWPQRIIMMESRYKILDGTFCSTLEEDVLSFKHIGLAIWYMFEGSFDITSLHTLWSQKSIYGLWFEEIDPVIELSQSNREKDYWQAYTNKMAKVIYDNFPSYRTSQ